MKLRLIYLVVTCLVFYACSSETGNTDEKKSIAPSNLFYSPSTLTYVDGEAAKTSSLPSIDKGSSEIKSYTLNTPPSGISINSENGQITVHNAAVGTHTLSVTVSNAELSTTFSSIFSVTVQSQPTAPVTLSYSSSTVQLEEGETSLLTANIDDGGSDITSFAEAEAFPSGITLNTSTGAINIANSVAIGSYQLSVTATNAVGSTNFTNVLTVNVITPRTGFNDVVSIFQSKCTPCHGSGGTEANFTDYNTAKNNITRILDRIQRLVGSNGFMPRNGNKLPQSEIDLIKEWQTDGLVEK